MIGELPRAPGGFEYCFVASDKFSQWIEVFPLVKATAEKTVQFIQRLTLRFGIPHRIITDLGTTFTGSKFWVYCENCGIEVCYASVAHPRANGQVERANGMILDGVKARMERTLKKAEGRWLKELYPVVWGLRTQPAKLHGNRLSLWFTGLKLSSQSMYYMALPVYKSLMKPWLSSKG